MRKARKGFTLVELLIVVAILGVLAAGLSMSSTDAVDAAGANNILNNLQSVKTAAMQMYIDHGSTLNVANLNKYLGKKTTSVKIGSGEGKYTVVATDSVWYAVYQFATSDTAGLKAKLADKAGGADLYLSTNATAFSYPYVVADENKYVALRVR